MRIEFRGRAPGNEKPAIRKAVENDFKNLIDPHLAKNQAGSKRVYARVEQPGWQRKFGNPQVKEPAHAIVHYYGGPNKHPDNILITKPVFEARSNFRDFIFNHCLADKIILLGLSSVGERRFIVLSLLLTQFRVPLRMTPSRPSPSPSRTPLHHPKKKK